jgi:hypothetical protein
MRPATPLANPGIPDHSITIDIRGLCQIAAIAKSDLPEASKRLEQDKLISIRHGHHHRCSTYTVHFSTEFGGSISDPQKALFHNSVGRLFAGWSGNWAGH